MTRPTRGYRGAGSWLRFLPAVTVAAFVHAALFFPHWLGLEAVGPPAPSPGVRSAAVELSVAAQASQVAGRAAATPAPEEELPEAPSTQKGEPNPDHSLRKAIEGSEVETETEVEAPDAAPVEPPLAKTEAPLPEQEVAPDAPSEPPRDSEPEPDPQVDPTPSAATAQLAPPRPSEQARERLREALAHIETDEGHLAAAHRRFSAQARAKTTSAPRAAEGFEEGLPQLDAEVPAGNSLLSYLELFGAELLARGTTSDRLWHLRRVGPSFEVRPIDRKELDRLAIARGLNLGYALPLDPVMGELPAPLVAAWRAVREQSSAAGAGEPQLFALGSTREQAAVAVAAQEYLRAHRESHPRYRIWSDARSIKFRYLVDERQAVYGVQVDALD